MNRIESTFSTPFRPFFIATAILCSTVPIIWVFMLKGSINLATSFIDNLNWHIHEMIYGVGTTILTGFLLTASANWTGKKPLAGTSLIILTILWIAARLSPFLENTLLITPIFNIVFSVLSFTHFIIMVLKNRNKYIIGPIYFILICSQIGFYYACDVQNQKITDWMINIALASLFHIIIIMNGRLVPMFTQNATSITIKRPTKIDNILAVLPLLIVYLPLDFFPNAISYLLIVIGVIIHTQRVITWKIQNTMGNTLLLILHIGQVFIAAYFLIAFLELHEILTRSMRIHFFTVGVLGIYIIGMLERVAKGHTGNLLKNDLLDNCFVAGIILVVPFRVFFPLIDTDNTVNYYIIAGLLWFFSFTGYLIKYFNLLTTPRLK